MCYNVGALVYLGIVLPSKQHFIYNMHSIIYYSTAAIVVYHELGTMW